MNNKLLFGSGWYNIEKDELGNSFIWSGRESELILIDNSIRCIDLIFNSDEYTSKTLIVSHGKLEEEYILNIGVNSFKFYPDLSLKSKSKIIIKTPSPFCPKDEIKNSNDVRELGQKLISINIDGGGIEISSILSSARMFEINPNIKLNSVDSLGISTFCITTPTSSVNSVIVKETNPILFNKSTLKTNENFNDFITYYTLLNNILSYTDNHILIINDGVKFIPDFNEYFPNFFKQVPSSWDIVYIGYDNIEETKVIVNSKIISGVPTNFKSIIINKNIIPILINSLELSELSFNNQLKNIILNKGLLSYLFTPSFSV